MKLLTVDTISQAQDKLLGYAQHILPKTEKITIENAAGRVLAYDAVAQENELLPFHSGRLCSESYRYPGGKRKHTNIPARG